MLCVEAVIFDDVVVVVVVVVECCCKCLFEYELKDEGVCIDRARSALIGSRHAYLSRRLGASTTLGRSESGFSLLSRSRMGTLKREKRTASHFSDASKTCIFAYLVSW